MEGYMTTYELMMKVKEALDEAGFETSSPKFVNLRDFEHQGTGIKDGKAWWEPVKGFTFKDFTGYAISFEVVHRHNGTDENKSVDIAIRNWKHSCGRLVVKERLNVNHSEKQIQNRIKKIIDQYNAIEI